MMRLPGPAQQLIDAAKPRAQESAAADLRRAVLRAAVARGRLDADHGCFGESREPFLEIACVTRRRC